MASFMDWLFGGPDKLKKFDTGTKEQQALHNNILAQAMGMSNGGGFSLANDYYNRLLGEDSGQAFNQFSQPYLQQFQDQILPQIAERFAGGGALSSSGFGQSLGGAASGLQSQLAQLFSQLQGQAAQAQYGQFNQLSNTGLGYQPFGYQHIPGSQGILGPLFANAGGQLASSGIGNLFKRSSGGGIS